MLRNKIKNKLLILIIIIIFTTIFLPPIKMAEEDSLVEVKGKLEDISQEEREILDFLFAKTQEIDELKREKDKITLDMELMQKEIDDLDRKIQKETSNYEEKLGLLEQVLRNYQRMGPASYIEIILDADSITNLLRRINTLRDLTRNTGELLEDIDGLKEELMEIKANLDEKLLLLREKENQLAETIEMEEGKAQELEEYLVSLKGDREYYEEQLQLIMDMVEELRALITGVSKEFAHIIEEGDLPEDSVKIKLTGRGLKGIIEEEVFNKVMEDKPNLPKIVLSFYANRVEMNFPEENLLLTGTFHIVEEQSLKFHVEEGDFYGFHLKAATLEELFREGDFVLDLEPLLGKSIMEDMEIKDNYMELTIGIKLF